MEHWDMVTIEDHEETNGTYMQKFDSPHGITRTAHYVTTPGNERNLRMMENFGVVNGS